MAVDLTDNKDLLYVGGALASIVALAIFMKPKTASSNSSANSTQPNYTNTGVIFVPTKGETVINYTWNDSNNQNSGNTTTSTTSTTTITNPVTGTANPTPTPTPQPVNHQPTPVVQPIGPARPTDPKPTYLNDYWTGVLATGHTTAVPTGGQTLSQLQQSEANLYGIPVDKVHIVGNSVQVDSADAFNHAHQVSEQGLYGHTF